MIKFVVCVWNAEKYIKNCIRTLKSQIDVDFKVFIIDDVSTDNTVETIKSLIVDDNRFDGDYPYFKDDSKYMKPNENKKYAENLHNHMKKIGIIKN